MSGQLSHAGSAQGLTHQGAASCTKPIHKAQAELASKAAPAKRTAHCPEPGPRRRSQSQGPAIRLKPLPRANSAITPAPCAASALSAATSNAEYSKPQGSKAQTVPSAKGAVRPATQPATVEAVKASAELQGIQAKGVTTHSDLISEAIIATMNKHGCDLIVMASHGRRGISRLLLGSETTHVLTHSPVPVLVLR